MKRLVDIVRPTLSDGRTIPWQVAAHMVTQPVFARMDIRDYTNIVPVDDVGTERRDLGAGSAHIGHEQVLYIGGTSLAWHVTLDFARVQQDHHPVVRPPNARRFALRHGEQDGIVAQVVLDRYGVQSLGVGYGLFWCEPAAHPVPAGQSRRLSLSERQAERISGYRRRSLLTVTQKARTQLADEQCSRMFDELGLRLLHPRGIPAVYEQADGTFHPLPDTPTKLKLSHAFDTPHALVNGRQVLNYIHGRPLLSEGNVAAYCTMLNNRIADGRLTRSRDRQYETQAGRSSGGFPTYDREKLSELMRLRGSHVA